MCLTSLGTFFYFSLMQAYQRLIFITVLLGILSCGIQESDEGVMPIEIPNESNAQFTFSQLIKPDLEIIPLELGHSAGLKGTDKCLIKDDFLFIGEPRVSRSLLIFNLRNKKEYHSPLEYGEGPNAFSQINDFLVYENQLMILDMVKQRIAIYDISVDSLSFNKFLPIDFWAERFAYDGEFGYFKNAGGTEPLFTITDNTFKSIETLGEKNAGHLLKPRNSFHQVSINGKETILFHTTFDNQIYEAKNGTISPWKRLNFGSGNSTIDLEKIPIQTDFDFFYNQMKPFNSRFTVFEKSGDKSHFLLYSREENPKVSIRSENLDINVPFANISNDVTFTSNIPMVSGTQQDSYIAVSSVDEIDQQAPDFIGSEVERLLKLNPETEYFLLVFQFK